VSVWRHARAIALLPGSVMIVVPAAILILGSGPNIGWGLDWPLVVLPALVGTALIAVGLGTWTWTVRLFARIGKGTLASWDPTRHLVVAGPYRYVRNPMIAAVVAVLLGQALLLGSTALLVWCATVFAINYAYFLAYEEPGLERRFGVEYRAYKAAVPRWIPRRTPWVPAA
jgi:protein-S-isoprenylcysteine O-methyltransferase Ste14